jgi:hypothetical protein
MSHSDMIGWEYKAISEGECKGKYVKIITALLYRHSSAIRQISHLSSPAGCSPPFTLKAFFMVLGQATHRTSAKLQKVCTD